MNAPVPVKPEITNTTCPYCGVGCGVSAQVVDQQLIAVSGDKAHPANRGRLCVKGSSLHETTDLKGRLLQPQIAGQEVSWDKAISHVASGFKEIIEEHGPDAVAFYLSGQILTEDYYVANKLMKGFIGSGNVDTNSRLCMASAVVAHKRAFGADLVSGCYEDLELADLLILTGSNTAWAHPIVYQRIVAAKQARPEMKVVVIDPRHTATCDIADLHLPLKPGSDGFLFSGLLNYLAEQGGLDNDFIQQHTEGFEETLSTALKATNSLEQTAQLCDLSTEQLQQFFVWFLTTERTVTLFSQGINQSSTGVDKGNSIINVHLATGRIGKPGATPFSITGQPNAMGGREVGGLANQLAAHMDFTKQENIDLVAEFWQAENMAQQEGLKAVDMFQAVHEGRIKAIWIMGTNPVVSMPDSNYIRAALEKCELVVVSDCVAETDTGQCADVLLPATGWGEKDGTVTNSERMISRQKGFLPPPGAAKHDWQIISAVAQQMGYKDAFSYHTPGEIFAEHARLSGYRNNGERFFNISGLSDLSEQDYNDLAPVQWPVADAESNQGKYRLFSDNHYATPTGRARFIPITPTLPFYSPSEEYPFILNTGRIRDQWHTMTRTGKASRLLNHISEPYVEISESDAEQLGITSDSLVEISNPLGSCTVKAVISPSQQQGSVFLPIHWNDQFSKSARADSLVRAVKDPLSGQPESKHSPVAVRALTNAWQGLLICRNKPQQPDVAYWSRVPGGELEVMRLVGTELPEDWLKWLNDFVQISADTVELSNSGSDLYRLASFDQGKLDLLFIATTEPDLPSETWLTEQFDLAVLNNQQRMDLLAARPAEPQEDVGAIICSCFQVGEKTIKKAVTAGASSTDELADLLKCGSNCGSCLPEIKALLFK